MPRVSMAAPAVAPSPITVRLREKQRLRAQYGISEKQLRAAYEQGTFPHSRSLEDTSELAEERRLAYVGIPRALRRLYVTRAAVRAGDDPPHRAVGGLQVEAECRVGDGRQRAVDLGFPDRWRQAPDAGGGSY